MPWRFNPFTGNLDETDIPAFNGEVTLGSAASPSIFFTGDPNTGIYSPGADQVAISTNGTGRLFVDASGRVGVGATPSNTFDVTATTNPIASIRTTTAATSVSVLKLEGYRTSADAGRLGEISIINTRDGDEQASIEITADGDTEGKFTFKSSTNSLCEFGNSFTRFFSSNTERLRITSDGKLGLGTSSPSRKLTVSDGGAGSSGGIGLQNTEGSYYLYTDGGNFFAYDDTVSAARLTINSSGNVGVGTTNPTQKLQITDGSLSNFYIAPGYNGGAGTTIGVGGGEYLAFNGSPFTTERMRIDSSGRLLVGTSSARSAVGVTSAFQVEGTGYDTSSLSLICNANSAGIAPNLILGKSRGTSVGSNTIVQSGDSIGDIAFAGADGSDLGQYAAKISAEVDGTPGANDMPGRLVLSTTKDGQSSPTAAVTIDSSQRLLVGTSSARSNFFNTNIAAGIQLEGLGDTNRLLSIVSNTNDAFSEPNLILGKTRGTSLGANTVVQSDDPLGSVCFQGTDGSEFVEAASIKAFVDGTPGANDMPGRIVLSTTPSGSATPTERLRITSAGVLQIADAGNIAVGTATGTKIGTGTTQKLGFWNATPVVQPAAVADATDAATVITQLNDLLAKLRTLGIIAT